MMRLLQIFFRCCRLRCPACGQGRLFRGLFRMPRQCPHCGLLYERESGFYLGAIYFNYGLTALLVTIAFPLLTLKGTVPRETMLIAALAFVLLFPLVFFRHARALWLGFDQLMDPQSVPDSGHKHDSPLD